MRRLYEQHFLRPPCALHRLAGRTSRELSKQNQLGCTLLRVSINSRSITAPNAAVPYGRLIAQVVAGGVLPTRRETPAIIDKQ